MLLIFLLILIGFSSDKCWVFIVNDRLWFSLQGSMKFHYIMICQQPSHGI